MHLGHGVLILSGGFYENGIKKSLAVAQLCALLQEQIQLHSFPLWSYNSEHLTHPLIEHGRVFLRKHGSADVRSDFIYDKATGTVAQQNISANQVLSAGKFLMLRLHYLALRLKLKMYIKRIKKKKIPQSRLQPNLFTGICLSRPCCLYFKYLLFFLSASDIALLSTETQRKLGKSIYMQITSSVCYWRHCVC